MSFVAAIDQGTTSTRCLVFDYQMTIVAGHQVEHKQHTPHPGWLEHDPMEIIENTCMCVKRAILKLKEKKGPGAKIMAVGITNQRETTVAWSRKSGKPLYNAIVWSDVRTQETVREIVQTVGRGDARFAADRCGLPCSTYFSGVKMQWMLRNVPAIREADECGDLMFGTIDSWLIYRMSGCRAHATDVTNASRTMLMDIRTLQWDAELCGFFGVSLNSLPQIVSNSEKVCEVACMMFADLVDVPIAGCIGDQQAALFGQACFLPGEAKSTYGTGCFLLSNVGTKLKISKQGLLSTVGYRIGKNGETQYALEGSIAGVGSTVQWMRDKMKWFSTWKESEQLALSVTSTGGVVFVPAFSGLFAPHWKEDARGTIVGMTLQTSREHIIRAAFEAITFQVADVVRAMESDAQTTFHCLRVDGGLTHNKFVVQNQADILGFPVYVPEMKETTALGAALCAGLAVGLWKDLESIRELKKNAGTEVISRTSEEERLERTELWKRGLSRSLGWAKM